MIPEILEQFIIFILSVTAFVIVFFVSMATITRIHKLKKQLSTAIDVAHVAYNPSLCIYRIILIYPKSTLQVPLSSPWCMNGVWETKSKDVALQYCANINQHIYKRELLDEWVCVTEPNYPPTDS